MSADTTAIERAQIALEWLKSLELDTGWLTVETNGSDQALAAIHYPTAADENKVIAAMRDKPDRVSVMGSHTCLTWVDGTFVRGGRSRDFEVKLFGDAKRLERFDVEVES